MRHAEQVIEDIEEYTPQSVQTMLPRNVAEEAVSKVQQLDDAVELLEET